MKNQPQTISQLILAKRPDFRPKVGLVLGSGSAALADKLQDAVSIPYHQLPDFPVSGVEGHPGRLLLGYLNTTPVACYQGRVHAYEGMKEKDFLLFIRVLKCLGCETLLMTNATGSLRPEFKPGQLVLISDHINFHPMNPLAGANDDTFGPRFFSMEDAYDKTLRQRLRDNAKKLNIELPEGVYFSVLGPSFESPAEIRAFRILGADVIGMSTVPEVIVARHCGMRVAVISVVTNLAAGLSNETITHEGTLHFAAKANHNLERLLESTIHQLYTVHA